MKEKLIYSALMFAFLVTADSKPLDLSKVSKDANWVIHMDFESMRDSEVGSFMLDYMEEVPEAVDRMEHMKRKYGVDMKTFSYLTMSGTGEKHKGIAIMKGGIDPKALTQFADSQDSLDVSQIGKQKVYSANRGRHSMAFAILKKGFVVGGPDDLYVSEGIQLAKSKTSKYDGHPLLDVLQKQIKNPGFLFFADVKNGSKMHDIHPRAKAMIENVRSAGIVIGDDAGSLGLTAVIETTSEETCQQVEAMVRGGMAMVDLKKASDKRIEKFILGHSIKRKGNTLWINIDFSMEAIVEHMEKEMKKSA